MKGLGCEHCVEIIGGRQSKCRVSGLVVPSLGVIPANKCKLRPSIISPYGRPYRLWENFLVSLVFYTSWFCPFEFAFLEKKSGPLTLADNAVNGLFGIDIMVTFFVAYLDESTYLLVDKPKLIAMRYVKSGMVLDIISVLPSEVIWTMFPPHFQIYGYLNIFRLWRLHRVSTFFSRLEKDRYYNYFWVRCLKLVFVTLFSVHLAACFFFFIAKQSDSNSTWLGLIPHGSDHSVWGSYITSVYWAAMTLASVGYGDLHPANSVEMIFNTTYMFFNLALTSYLIGNMTNLVVHWTSKTRKFRDKVEAASNFAKRNSLPDLLQEQMFAHLHMKSRIDSEGLHENNTIEFLPKAIHSTIAHHLFSKLVRKVYLLHGVSQDLLFRMVNEMKAEYFPPNEEIIVQNETPSDFYLLITGAVEIIMQREGKQTIIDEVKIGDLIGEIGVVCNRPQLFTVRTKQLSQLLRINRTTFLNLVHANDGDVTIIMNNFLQYLYDSEEPIMIEILGEMEAIMARDRMDSQVSLLFAVRRGDDILLHHLLRKGADPNEADKTGNTALHVAASRGHHCCAALLLQFGANPNIDDEDGSVPLLEAIWGRHESVIKLLVDNDANLSRGDVGNFACICIEQKCNKLELLKDIVKYGGDLTQPSRKRPNCTPLHAAVCEGDIELVKFLLDKGADIDKQDANRWTPRDFAEHQCHEDIQKLFLISGSSQNKVSSSSSSSPIMKMHKKHGGGTVRCKSESSLLSLVFPPKHHQERIMSQNHQEKKSKKGLTWVEKRRMMKRAISTRKDSLLGILSLSPADKDKDKDPYKFQCKQTTTSKKEVSTRVIVGFPEKGEHAKMLVFLPDSLQELLNIGAKKFHFSPTKILTKEGAEIEDIRLIRDGDFLLLV